VGLDSEDTISDFFLHHGEVNKRKTSKKVTKKKLLFDHGIPKCLQFVEACKEGRGAAIRKGRGQQGGKKQSVVEDFVRSLPVSCGQPTPHSGLKLIMEESGSWVPESPLNMGECSNRKVLDAARLFSLQKKKMAFLSKWWTKSLSLNWLFLKI